MNELHQRLLQEYESVNLWAEQHDCQHPISEIHLLIGHLLELCKNQIQYLKSLNIHNFSTIDDQ